MQVATTYADAICTKYPEQVAICIAKDAQGKYNPITLGWVMPTSHDPPMFAISIGLTRHSLEAIRLAGEFVIAFPSTEMADDALFHGSKSGRDMDKLAECGTATIPATEIDCVLLADAVANFECVLESELLTGDHVIFTGKVVASHKNDDPNVCRVYSVAPNHVLGAITRA